MLKPTDEHTRTHPGGHPPRRRRLPHRAPDPVAAAGTDAPSARGRLMAGSLFACACFSFCAPSLPSLPPSVPPSLPSLLPTSLTPLLSLSPPPPSTSHPLALALSLCLGVLPPYPLPCLHPSTCPSPTLVPSIHPSHYLSFAPSPPPSPSNSP